MPEGFDRVIARALAKDPADRYPSAGDLGRAAEAAADGRPGHGVRAHGRARRGRAGADAGDERPRGAPPPPANGRTAIQPGVTLPLGDRPHRRRGLAFTLLLATLAAAAVVGVLLLAPGGEVDASRLPGAPVTDGEVEGLAQSFARAYGEEDTRWIGRLLTRDVQRVVPGARQVGRARACRVRLLVPRAPFAGRTASSRRPRPGR